MNEEIGTAAGKVWEVLQGGEATLSDLKKKTDVKSPALEFGVGWLAREDKIEITRDKRAYRLRLK